MNNKLIIFKRLLIIVLAFSTMIIYPMFSPKRGGVVVSDSFSPRRKQAPQEFMKECPSSTDITLLPKQSEESEQRQPSSDQIKPEIIIKVCKHLEHRTEFSKFFLIVVRSDERIAYKICCSSIMFPSGEMCCKELFGQMFDELIKDGFQEIVDPDQDYLGVSSQKQSIIRLIKYRGFLVESVVDLFCLFNQSAWSGVLNKPTDETFPDFIMLDRPTLWKTKL